MPRPVAYLLLVCLLTAGAGSTARAQEFRWSQSEPSYPALTTVEWVASAAAFATSMGLFLLWEPQHPRWRGPILFDEAVRDVVLVRDDSTRRTLSTVSDVPFYMLLSLPTALEAGVVVAGLKGRPGVGLQMFGMNLLTYGVAGTLAYGISAAVARERPFAEHCLDNPDYDSGCDSAGSRNSSFFSGHAAAAFTGAGLTCAHHQFLPIYGGGAVDTGVCVTALTLATSVTVLRLVTDNHYFSDGVVGAAVGLGVGYGVPYLLHYQHGRLPQGLSLMPQVGRGNYGLSVRVLN